MGLKLVGISGTVTGSKTAIIVQYVLDQVKRNHPSIDVELLDLKQVDLPFCDGRDPLTYTGDAKKTIDLLASADFFVVGTPIFRASLTGALKNLFDLVPDDVFRNKVMGLVANGGTYQHYLVVENQVKPIAGYFRCYTAPSVVYLHGGHFNAANEIMDPAMLKRLDGLAEEIVMMQSGIKALAAQ